MRNRLYGVEDGERLVFPEIPCSFDGSWTHRGEYAACVTAALTDLARAGVLDPQAQNRFLLSVLRAFDEQ